MAIENQAQRSWTTGVAAVAALLMLLGACTGSAEVTVSDTAGSQAEATATAPAATLVPTQSATAVPVQPAPTSPDVVGPSCAEVPVFNAADSVSITCAGGYAVSPELFASNAGWHLFQAQNGQWVEIDYAMTCCDPEEVPFTELLTRNGVNPATVTNLCAGSGVGPDSITGCATSGDPDTVPLADTGWLRVNGLGDHDFGAVDSDVLASITPVFGPPLSANEQSECGAGPMTQVSFDDFTVNFQAGEFVGWFYRSSSPALASPSGVAPGISEAALIQVYEGVEIFDETLGREFSFVVPAGFMGGFLEDDGSAVRAMYAGVNCFFR